MKRVINLCVGITLAITPFVACKRTAELSPDVKDATNIRVRDRSSTMKSVFLDGTLDSSTILTQYSPGGEHLRTVIPFVEKPGAKVFRYVAYEKSLTSKDVIPGFIVSRERLTSKSNLFLQSISANDIAFYSAQGNTKFKRNKITLKKESVSYDLGTPTVNLLPPCGSGVGPGQPVCIDWYWALYNADTGEIIEETYLYTTCEDPCENDGGGPSPGEDCSSIAEGLEGSTLSESAGSEIVSESATEKQKKYRWVFFRQWMGLWQFTSHENAKFEPTGDPTNPWRFKEFTHEKESRQGMMIGGTISCTVNSAEPYIAASGGFAAGMELEYTISMYAVCRGFPINNEVNYTSAKVWSVND